MQKIALARNAMATRFEFVLCGNDPVRLRAAGEEALDEIGRIENQLSLYRPGSEIAQVNAQADQRPVRVSPPVFDLLLQARRLWELTRGSFDISVAPLVRCWGFMKGTGALPSGESIRVARELTGMDRVALDRSNCTVRFERPGMMLDLGSIGKGYALDRAGEILRDAGVENALLHGGTSTILAIGTSADEERNPWRVAVEQPPLETASKAETPPVLAVVDLEDRALSVSAVSGKYFVAEGKTFGHVIDPRTGEPAREALLGAARMATGAESDALSTAVLLARENDLAELSTNLPDLAYLQVQIAEGVKCDGGSVKVLRHGISEQKLTA